MLDNLVHFLTAHCLIFLDSRQLEYYYYFKRWSVKLLRGCYAITVNKWTLL